MILNCKHQNAQGRNLSGCGNKQVIALLSGGRVAFKWSYCFWVIMLLSGGRAASRWSYCFRVVVLLSGGRVAFGWSSPFVWSCNVQIGATFSHQLSVTNFRFLTFGGRNVWVIAMVGWSYNPFGWPSDFRVVVWRSDCSLVVMTSGYNWVTLLIDSSI